MPFPRRTRYDHRPRPKRSTPYSMIRDVQFPQAIVRVPPGCISEVKESLVEDLDTAECLHILRILL